MGCVSSELAVSLPFLGDTQTELVYGNNETTSKDDSCAADQARKLAHIRAEISRFTEKCFQGKIWNLFPIIAVNEKLQDRTV